MIATLESGGPVPVGMVFPFCLLLFLIATMPFIHRHWWEAHYTKVSAVLGLLVIGYYFLVRRDGIHPLHTGVDFISFISLIGSLFVVAGGIHIRTRGESTPLRNVLFLLGASVLSNVIGTTGASMLLIRPWVRMNKYRITGFHVVFFIFIVSNVSGCLTPIGDPPLFLGYLRGVPFFWTLEALILPWGMALTLLLTVFYYLDRHNFLRAPKTIRELETANETIEFEFKSLIPLAVILGSVFISKPLFLREVLMLVAAAYSYWRTPRPIHDANHFSLDPIKEVAWIFFGIFSTMMPAIEYLEINAVNMGINTPTKFYLTTGVLSSVLDNAPTYLTFLGASLGLFGKSVDQYGDVIWFVQNHAIFIKAISMGAVFFGAMTYIGNGPNLMVKSIADHAKVHTPSFFKYIFYYSIPILLPILLFVGWLFLRS
ncbi:MAG: sodium:proton antiporter [Verrucomicrobiota bacterium]